MRAILREKKCLGKPRGLEQEFTIYIYIVQAGVQAPEKDLPTIHTHTKH